MSKKPNETFAEYKVRVIDPISPSFCAAKWLNSTIWLSSGTTASCHLPPAHHISQEEIKDNPSALHNTIHKKVMRDQMLKGERPTECEYCWKIEDIKRNNLSDRVFKTAAFSEEDIQKISKAPANENAVPRTLEIAFDRTCNFACSYCNASFSTKWGSDIEKNGVYKNLRSDGSGAFRMNGSWTEPFKGKENPYVEAFWKWWPELSQHLEELRVTGGEPLLSKDLWKLLDLMIANGQGKTRLAINSNLGAPDELFSKFMEKISGLSHLDLYTSCEAMNAQAEYIRDGLNFDLWKNRLELLMEKGTYRHIHMMLTINSLCLFSLPEFLDLMVAWKEKYGAERAPIWTLNILRFPSFMSALALPSEIRKERHQALNNWLDKNKLNPLISESEKGTVERLIDYLDVVQTPHKASSAQEDLERDFKNFFTQYDTRRGKSISQTFPMLKQWLDSIDPKPFAYQNDFVDGDSTKGWHNEIELQYLAKRMGMRYPFKT